RRITHRQRSNHTPRRSRQPVKSLQHHSSRLLDQPVSKRRLAQREITRNRELPRPWIGSLRTGYHPTHQDLRIIRRIIPRNSRIETIAIIHRQHRIGRIVVVKSRPIKIPYPILHEHAARPPAHGIHHHPFRHPRLAFHRQLHQRRTLPARAGVPRRPKIAQHLPLAEIRRPIKPDLMLSSHRDRHHPLPRTGTRTRTRTGVRTGTRVRTRSRMPEYIGVAEIAFLQIDYRVTRIVRKTQAPIIAISDILRFLVKIRLMGGIDSHDTTPAETKPTGVMLIPNRRPAKDPGRVAPGNNLRYRHRQMFPMYEIRRDSMPPAHMSPVDAKRVLLVVHQPLPMQKKRPVWVIRPVSSRRKMERRPPLWSRRKFRRQAFHFTPAANWTNDP